VLSKGVEGDYIPLGQSPLLTKKEEKKFIIL
jgi:hypothetical protein